MPRLERRVLLCTGWVDKLSERVYCKHGAAAGASCVQARAQRTRERSFGKLAVARGYLHEQTHMAAVSRHMGNRFSTSGDNVKVWKVGDKLRVLALKRKINRLMNAELQVVQQLDIRA